MIRTEIRIVGAIRMRGGRDRETLIRFDRLMADRPGIHARRRKFALFQTAAG